MYRGLSSTEVSTALRPFYFSVHPDLFGQYPEERVGIFNHNGNFLEQIPVNCIFQTVNENSLKQLSSYLETVQQNRMGSPLTLKFYLKPHRVQSVKSLKSVQIHLNDKSLKRVVTSILQSCDLPTTYVDKIESPERKSRIFTESDARKFYENLSKQEAEFYENDPIVSKFVNRLKKSRDEERLK